MDTLRFCETLLTEMLSENTFFSQRCFVKLSGRSLPPVVRMPLVGIVTIPSVIIIPVPAGPIIIFPALVTTRSAATIIMASIAAGAATVSRLAAQITVQTWAELFMLLAGPIVVSCQFLSTMWTRFPTICGFTSGCCAARRGSLMHRHC